MRLSVQTFRECYSLIPLSSSLYSTILIFVCSKSTLCCGSQADAPARGFASQCPAGQTHTHTHTCTHFLFNSQQDLTKSRPERTQRRPLCLLLFSIRPGSNQKTAYTWINSQTEPSTEWYAMICSGQVCCYGEGNDWPGSRLQCSLPKTACLHTHSSSTTHTDTHTHTHTLTHTHNLTQGSAEISRLIAVVLRVKPFEWKWKCITKTHRHQEQLWVREMTCYENILCTSQLEVERSACVYGGERSQRVKLLVRAPEKPPIRSFTFRLLEMLLCASYYDLMLLFIEHNFFGVRRQAGTSSTIDSSTKASHLKAVAQINTLRQQWLITHYHVSALNKPTRVPHNASRTICLAYPQSFSQDRQSHDTPRTHNSKWCGSPPQCILQGHCSLVVETGRDDLWTCWHCL